MYFLNTFVRLDNFSNGWRWFLNQHASRFVAICKLSRNIVTKQLDLAKRLLSSKIKLSFDTQDTFPTLCNISIHFITHFVHKIFLHKLLIFDGIWYHSVTYFLNDTLNPDFFSTRAVSCRIDVSSFTVLGLLDFQFCLVACCFTFTL